ncbi:MAG: NAD(+) diphosphatase [Arenimonas sp.]
MNGAPREYAFLHAGLDRAEHLREDRAALATLWPAARVLVVDVEGLLRHPPGDDAVPEFCLASTLAPELPAAAAFLGLDGDVPHFALAAEALADDLPAATIDLRSAAARWPGLPASAFAQARALLFWQQRNRHCGACGQAMTMGRGGFSARCAQCGIEHYPRTDPAIIVAVSDGERLLLGRQAGWPEGRWSVLAGFLEPGESLEQTVVREVWEEAGVRVHACEYAGSQPWPFPASLMVGFHAQAEAQPVQVGDELEAAAWFTATELRERFASGTMKPSPRLSISRWLMEDWLRRQG